MAKLTNEQLAEIRQRADAATEGPWAVFPDKCGPEGQGVFNDENFGCICEVGDPYPRGNNKPTENMNFIASARTDVPALLDMITELQSENKLLETSFEESDRNKNRYADEVERLRNEISFIANVDMVKNAHDAEHVAVSVKSWASDTLEGVKRR
ncbi:hypothetical protein ABFV99_14025 [Cytobacillus horneckiae]|uniref:hypothetical protein n=1 Tax=Cytobacillus horneckiae TaxID=549687 RepID=UPI0034CD8658